MKKTLFAIAMLSLTQTAWAHLSYSNRNFGTYTGLTDASYTISNQTVTGNFAWADAADGNLADSHKGKAFRFTLENEAWVDLNISANASATGNSVGGLLPGFSIYSGLAAISPYTTPQTSADYDTAAASLAWRTSWAQANLGADKTYADTDGSWNALGDWKMGGDGDPAGLESALSSFIYIASASSSTNTVSGRFLLGAGDYTLFIGGNDITNKADPINSLRAYGLSAMFSVSAVPEPESMALLLAGLVLIGQQARRANKASK